VLLEIVVSVCLAVCGYASLRGRRYRVLTTALATVAPTDAVTVLVKWAGATAPHALPATAIIHGVLRGVNTLRFDVVLAQVIVNLACMAYKTAP
jgi:hypothetical protein